MKELLIDLGNALLLIRNRWCHSCDDTQDLPNYRETLSIDIVSSHKVWIQNTGS
jgi:hypothetical protein